MGASVGQPSRIAVVALSFFFMVLGASGSENARAADEAKAKPQAEELDPSGHKFFEKKSGPALTLFTPGGEITAYGNFDVSVDVTAKKTNSLDLGGKSEPLGNMGFMPAISTNLSYLGARGFQRINDQTFNFVYQTELGFDISATPGLKTSNSQLSNTVNGAMFNRNTYIGLSAPTWGAVKVGKTDAPYKISTAELNPFSGMIGDYAAIMGNSGGDNRVEFGTRVDHALWYESPGFSGGYKFNVLFAPGQNRSSTSDNTAAGESDCAGGNDPTSGANVPAACNDGAFSDLASASASYSSGPFYVTAAYEIHQKVNRQGDITALYGAASVAALTPSEKAEYDANIGAEDAAKVGAYYRLQSKTTIGAIVESMHRYVSSDLSYQNERQRFGSWLVVTQELSDTENLYFGWAHAFTSPGDPGQHNDSTLTTSDGVGAYAPTHNQADMITLAYKRKYSSNLTWYSDIAATFNGPNAHYDLGAGGRGVTTDCHDATSTSGGASANNHCFTGANLAGVSTGLQWKF